MPELLTLASSPAAGAGPKLVLDLLVILGAAALMSVMLRRLHLASIPGYLIIGALLGSMPKDWGLLSSPENVGQISEIAVILLMFTIGLHLDLESIKTGMVPILLVGLASTLLSALLIWPAALAFGLPAPAALLVGLALSMSSTAVAIGILQRHKEVHLIHGRICVGVSIVQDLLCIPVLAMMPAIALWAGAHGAEPAPVQESLSGTWSAVSAGLRAVGGIVVLLAFAKFVLPGLLSEASKGGNTEGLLVASAGAGLTAAVITGWLGFGPALGAFLAGFMLSNTPFRFQLAGQLSPMRDLFMAVFFTAVGVQLDVTAVLPYWWVVLLGVGVVLVIKTTVIGVCTWGGGATAPISLLVGLLLGQVGEFSLVILAEGQGQGIISGEVYSIIIGIVVVSLIGATPLADLGRGHMHRLAGIRPTGWIRSAALRENKPPPPRPKPRPRNAAHAEGAAPAGEPEHAGKHIIIAGFGVVGRNLAEHFSARGIDFTIVDLNTGTVARQNELGRRTVYGDISNLDVLESAGLHDAEAVVITIPDDDMALRAVGTIRKVRSDVFIAVRAGYLSRAIMAHEAGADHVTIEEVATAQDMAVKVLDQLDRRLAKARPEGTPHL
jgi:CPA2 family monovalent cation:H+ antiporter-2